MREVSLSQKRDWCDMFEYRPTDGALIWSKSRGPYGFPSEKAWRAWRTQFAGSVAGTTRLHRYVCVYIHGRRQPAHRIIWEMHNGPIPTGMQIDHINGIRHDNRIENLRLATASQNKINSAMYRNNTSGAKGVFLNKRTGRYIARIGWNGRKVHLGTFATAGEAERAYLARAAILHREFCRSLASV